MTQEYWKCRECGAHCYMDSSLAVNGCCCKRCSDKFHQRMEMSELRTSYDRLEMANEAVLSALSAANAALQRSYEKIAELERERDSVRNNFTSGVLCACLKRVLPMVGRSKWET